MIRKAVELSSYLFIFALISQQELCFAEKVADQTLLDCAKSMSAPIRFRVSCSPPNIPKQLVPLLTDGPFSKSYKASRDQRMDYVVSKGLIAGESSAVFEYVSPNFTQVCLLRGTRCYELFPKYKSAIDASFRFNERHSEYVELVEFDLQGTTSIVDSGDEHWLVSVLTPEKEIKIRINRLTHLPESKQVFDRKSTSLLRDYRYSDIVRDQVFEEDFFSVPKGYVQETAVNLEDYTMRLGRIMKPKDIPIDSPLPRRSPRTGERLPSPPPGMSDEEFAKRISEGILKIPVPNEDKARRQRLAEKWRNNVSLEAVAPDPPPKAVRGYGSVWLYVGIFLAITILGVLGLRFWMSN